MTGPDDVPHVEACAGVAEVGAGVAEQIEQVEQEATGDGLD